MRRETNWALLILLGIGAGAGCNQTSSAGGSGEVNSITSRASGLQAPLDAVPSLDGSMLYFTALDAMGVGGVYSVSCSGGTPMLLAGELGNLVAIALSADGKTLYVADLGVTNDDDALGDGEIFSVSVSGGAKAEVAATKGYRPRGLDTGMGDIVYFSGTDLTSGNPGVFQLTGGAVTAIATGDPFGEPSGIAATRGGDLYVSDVGSTSGRIIAVKKGAATELMSGLKLGFPAGIALSLDEKFLLVSGFSADTNGAEVYRVELASQAIDGFDTGISMNTESAGLHRARNVDKFVWADSGVSDESGMGGGTVYEVGTKAARLCK